MAMLTERRKLGLARSWGQLTAFQRIMAVWLVAVLFIFAAGWLGVVLLPERFGWGEGVPPQLYDIVPNPANIFIRWDSGYYLKIAQQGYTIDGTERAFFPLYPALVRLLSTVSGLPIEISGLMISALSFACAVKLLYVWVLQDYNSSIALKSTLLLCFSPIAYYCVAFYPEALFLALSIGSLYTARRGWFFLSGLTIALAGATRPTAFLLGLFFVLEIALQRPNTLRSWIGVIAGALVAPLGALTYFAYLGQSGGVAQGIAAYSALLKTEWDTRYAWPWDLVYSATTAVLYAQNITADWFSRAFTMHDMIFALGGLAVSIWAVRSLRLSAGVFLLANSLYIMVLHGPGGYAFDSAPRRLLIVAPLYLALALLFSKAQARIWWLYLAVSIGWLGILSAWFATGRWVS